MAWGRDKVVACSVGWGWGRYWWPEIYMQYNYVYFVYSFMLTECLLKAKQSG